MDLGKAVAIAKSCPLVLWDYAGALDMLGRHKDAIAIYRRLIRRGVESIAYDECGEGIGRARGLVADCHYRTARCLRKLGRESESLKAFRVHLDMRGPGCFSIYPLKDVAKEAEHFRDVRPNKRMHTMRRRTPRV